LVSATIRRRGGSGCAQQHRVTGEQISLSGTQHQDLLTLLFANSLEALPRCSWFERRGMRMALDTIEGSPFHRSKERSTDGCPVVGDLEMRNQPNHSLR
jgi:hypothetical protein